MKKYLLLIAVTLSVYAVVAILFPTHFSVIECIRQLIETTAPRGIEIVVERLQRH